MPKLTAAKRRNAGVVLKALYHIRGRKSGTKAQRDKVWDAALAVYDTDYPKGDRNFSEAVMNLLTGGKPQAGPGAIDWAKLLETLIPLILQLLAMFL